MDKNKGFKNLFAKSIAVITASIGALLSGNANAQLNLPKESTDGKNQDEKVQDKPSKPQLILKSNPNNRNDLLLAMHTSHSSHSSHSSHYSSSTSGHSSHMSHASHVSHYSSAPSFTPQNTVPYSIPSYPKSPSTPSSSTATGTTTRSTPERSINKNPSVTSDPLTIGTFKRVLRKGCKGTDVEDAQTTLSLLGYDIIITGYFGENTEEVVKKFQLENDLNADGVIGAKTYQIMEDKSY